MLTHTTHWIVETPAEQNHSYSYRSGIGKTERLSISVYTGNELAFSIRRGGPLSGLPARLGLCSELELLLPPALSSYRIITEKTATTASLAIDPRFLEPLGELLTLGFEEIELKNGVLSAIHRRFSAETEEMDCEYAAALLDRMAEIFPPRNFGRFSALREVYEPYLHQLPWLIYAVLLVGSLLAFSDAGWRHPLVDVSGFLPTVLRVSIVAYLLVAVATVWYFRKRTSFSLQFWLLFIFIPLVIGPAADAAVSAINVGLDDSPPTIVLSRIEKLRADRQMLVRSESFSLPLSPSRSISAQEYREGNTVAVAVRRGYLGFPWISHGPLPVTRLEHGLPPYKPLVHETSSGMPARWKHWIVIGLLVGLSALRGRKQ